MDYKAPVETYTGKVREVTIGKGDKAVKVGGESVLPFHFFEGTVDNRPRVALEVQDIQPDDWADGALEPYKTVAADPVAWAKKCVEYGAELVCLRLVGTDPGGKNGPAATAAEVAGKVAAAIPVPLIVYGSGDETKDIEVLVKVAEICAGENLLIGPVVKENYEPIGKAVMDNGHCIIAQSPCDINLEKELSIKLLKFFPAERMVIDPLSPALGYGMEYSYTIIERTKHTGIMFKDAMMQMPVIADLGGDAWKTKEAKADKKQGLLWEGLTAMSLLLAGANILVLRHPDNCRLIKEAAQGKF